MSRRLSGLGLVVVAVLALGGCRGEDPGAGAPLPRQVDDVAAAPGAAPAAATTRALLLEFGDEPPGEVLTSFENSGTAPVRTRAVTWGGGRVISARSPHGPAARLPAFDARDPEFAILSVVSRVSDDALSPGDQDFAFGAEMSLDDRSHGSAGDDGDNLIQRGLYEGSSQYKIQVDDGRPSCRIRGLTGEVIVTAEARVVPERWYRVRCLRRGDTVTLEVARMHAGEAPDWAAVSRSGRIGAVLMHRQTPLSIGGKLAEDGSLLPSSTDQFNGSVSQVFYRLLD